MVATLLSLPSSSIEQGTARSTSLFYMNSRSTGAADSLGMCRRRYESRSVRVIRPRNLSAAITMATRPRSKTCSKSLMFAFGDKRFEPVGHRAFHRVVKMGRIAMHFYEQIGFVDNADRRARF